MVTDAANNVYVTGSAQGSLDGQVWSGFPDGFVQKYDVSGAKLWTRQFGTNKSDAGSDIVLDAAGDLLISGSTGGSLDGNVSAGGYDLFVTRYTAAGVKQGTHQRGTVEDENETFVAALTDGTPVVAATTDGKFAANKVTGTDIIAAVLCAP